MIELCRKNIELVLSVCFISNMSCLLFHTLEMTVLNQTLTTYLQCSQGSDIEPIGLAWWTSLHLHWLLQTMPHPGLQGLYNPVDHQGISHSQRTTWWLGQRWMFQTWCHWFPSWQSSNNAVLGASRWDQEAVCSDVRPQGRQHLENMTNMLLSHNIRAFM